MAAITLTSAKETFVTQYYPDKYIGPTPALFVCNFSNPGDSYRSLLQFDLSNIPVTSTIDSAYLQLSIFRNEAQNDLTLGAFRVLHYWNEFTVNWSNQPLFSNVTDSSIAISPGALGMIRITISELVRGWHDGSIPNHGLILKGNENQNSLVGFRSRGYPDSTDWPRLVVSFLDGGIVIYPDEYLTLESSGIVTSTSILLGSRKQASFLIRNAGEASVRAAVQVSNDGYNWVDTPVEAMVRSKETAALTTDTVAMYARAAIYSSGACTVIISDGAREK